MTSSNAPAPPAEAPLTGIRVTQVATYLAGPFVGRVLADLGAEVIEVEAPGSDRKRSWSWCAVHRGWRSIILDLKTTAGVAVLHDLIRLSDVFVENFRPGVADRLGVGYADLSAVNKRLIYCSVSGFGQWGPLSPLATTDGAVQAFAGALQYSGNGTDFGVPLGLPVADLSAGAGGAHAVLAALYARERSGRGCRIDISLAESLMNWMRAAGRPGDLAGPPKTLIASAADGKLLLLQAARDNVFRRLVEALSTAEGCGHLAADERFATVEACRANVAAYKAEASAALAKRPAAEWIEILANAGVPAGPAQTMAEALLDPHIVERGAFEVVDHPQEGGQFRIPGSPYMIDGRRLSAQTPPPRFGEHAEAILREVLGYSANQITDLRARAVVG